ncbi:hypothetical protein KY290_025029 [Solanum tuberosum]|uniref:Ty3 transposon capsid-like protein domain-containing protein n=1 Tax=Solanum tuberosum TaxID=4113 RepID=A0ABQ7USM2_SOLTU|nr:hypothetical protein KY284_023882 [Solanum tuberosum]KAH0754759.1 hypothetical protein KY290_025029 [Solanum tuberosum]
MEGMTSINDRNTQTDKELLEIKEAIGYMNTRGREREPDRVESSNARRCSIECPHENRPREMHNGVPPTVPFDQRVRVTSIHLEGEAIAWHRSYIKSRNSVLDPTWTKCVLALSERFGEGFEDPMDELKNLQQTSTVKEYQAEFDRLLTGVNLSTENTISCFLEVLKLELNKSIRIQNPRTLMQAYKIARLQEGVFEAQAQSWGLKTNNKPQHAILSTPTTFKPQTFQKPFISNPTFRKPFEPNGSRVNSDEKYVVGHICKAKKQIFLVDVIEDEAESELVELEKEVREETNEFMTISLQAFTGVTAYQTIRVIGYHEKRHLQVLIVTGSTHNFIDQEVAMKLGCKANPILEQSISVADGRKVQTASIWQKKHVLRGASSQLKATKARALNKIDEEDAQFFMISLLQKGSEVLSCHNIQADQGMVVSPELSILIDQYASIFAIPTTLPPHRGPFDHRIPLVDTQF